MHWTLGNQTLKPLNFLEKNNIMTKFMMSEICTEVLFL